MNPFDSKYKSVPVQVLINRKDENGTISEIVYSITQFKPYFDFDESEYYVLFFIIQKNFFQIIGLIE